MGPTNPERWITFRRAHCNPVRPQVSPSQFAPCGYCTEEKKREPMLPRAGVQQRKRKRKRKRKKKESSAGRPRLKNKGQKPRRRKKRENEEEKEKKIEK